MAKNKKKQKHVADTPPVQIPVEPQTISSETDVPLTNMQRLGQVETRLAQMVSIINNLIQYCNTLEQWRTLTFKHDENAQPPATTEEDISFNADGQGVSDNGVTEHTQKVVPATTSE